MVAFCSALGCSENGKKGNCVSLHGFPKDESMRNKWLVAIGRRNFIPKSHTKICSKHFRKSDFNANFGKITLKKDAVPTIFEFNELFGTKRVCDVHFDVDCRVPGRAGANLRVESVPSLFLPLQLPDKSEPILTMSDTNVVTIIVPRDDSDDFLNFPIHEKGEPVGHQELKQHHCRTCMNSTDNISNTSVSTYLLLERTVKEVIIFLVPEMESKLRDDDIVCSKCLAILKSTMNFIVKCLETDAILTRQKEANERQIIGVFSSNDAGNIEAVDDSFKEVFTEHDYCGNMSVTDIVAVSDLTEVNGNVTISEPTIDQCNDDDNIEVEYVANDVEIQSESQPYIVGMTEVEEKLEDETLVLHDRCEEETGTFRCSLCGESFSTKEHHEQHLEIHRPYICEICGKSFTKRNSLRAHSFSHNDPNSYICEVCGNGFKDYASLHSHLSSHTSEESLVCDKCSKKFKTEKMLDMHIKYVHDRRYGTQCTICGILTRNESSLKTHVRLVHVKEKPFECDICHKKFGRSDYLRNHKQRHSAQQRLSEMQQSQTEKVKSRTKTRFKIHDTGEPVPCKFCGQWYKDVVRLRRHLDTHLKRYSCQFCPLTFLRKVLRKKHEETHLGGTVTFYRCNVCWKKFATNEALDKHIKCHDNPQHFCDLCGKVFYRKFVLNQHKLEDHSDVTDKERPEEIILDSLLEVGGLSSLDG